MYISYIDRCLLYIHATKAIGFFNLFVSEFDEFNNCKIIRCMLEMCQLENGPESNYSCIVCDVEYV